LKYSNRPDSASIASLIGSSDGLGIASARPALATNQLHGYFEIFRHVDRPDDSPDAENARSPELAQDQGHFALRALFDGVPPQGVRQGIG